MRVPLSWLKELVDIPADLTVEELAERLTVAGLEVGKLYYLGLPQTTPPHITFPPSDHLVWNDDKIVLGFIHEVKPHPDADRLILAMVDHGTGEVEQIVTGAPNLIPYKGQSFAAPIPVPIAREGAEVYDGHAETPGKRMILKEKAIRGIPNRHMVCSELELGLSEEHEGVLLLDAAEFGHLPAGTPLSQVLGDVVLDVEMTPNLARCFSMLGVAREVAAILATQLREPDYSLPNLGSDEIQNYVDIRIEHPELNPRFTLALLKDITIQPSPQWLQRRLKLIGQRPINNIVDVTNYVMFEIGQPTHAFDYDILLDRANGQKPTIITRLPQAGEHLTTLDGTDHALQGHNLLVADESGALSLAGVMGGLESEVRDASDDFAGSQTILLEAAAWNFINIRQTISSTKQHSEAGARFSRGVHPQMSIRGLARAAKLMVEVSGGVLVGGIIDDYPQPEPVVVLDFPFGEVARILGFAIPKAEVVDILRRLQFSVEEQGDILRVTVPDHRLDIGEGVVGWADLLEEISRIYGYNNIPNTQIGDELPVQRSNPSLEGEESTRDLLVQAGLREVITYRLTTPEREALLIPEGLAWAWEAGDYVELANPIASDKTVMRQTLLAGLLEVAEQNTHHHSSQAIFEVGLVYLGNKEQNLPEEKTRLGILMMGLRGESDWRGGQASGYLDFYDLKGVISSLLSGLRISPKFIQYSVTIHNSFRPNRVAELSINGENVGYLGEVHPLVAEAYGIEVDLNRPIVAAELDLDRLLSYAQVGHAIKPIPTQPAVYQDISFLVDRQTPAAEIETVIWKAGKELLAGVQLFDVYTGEQVPDDQKSMAYALTYQHPSETLTDKQVAKVHKAIVGALEHQLKAKLRA